MKKVFLAATIAAFVVSACSKEFTKKHEARFKLNGTQYNCGEDMVTANYYNGDAKKLKVAAIGGSGQTYTPYILLDLNKLNQVVQIDSAQTGFSYIHTSGGVSYLPKRGTWEITSHKEGNPASRHTEGKFEMVVFNVSNPKDTFNITDGYFYVNNY